MLIKMQRPKTGNLLPCVAGVNMETYRPSTWQPSQINTVEGVGRWSKGGGLEAAVDQGGGIHGGALRAEHGTISG